MSLSFLTLWGLYAIIRRAPKRWWLYAWLLALPIMAAIVAGTFIIYKHSSNIQRLRSGQEHVFGFGAHKP